MRHHIWSYPDATGAKHCLYEGCTIRVRRAYAEWQPGKGARWVSIISADVPKCTGRAPTEGK